MAANSKIIKVCFWPANFANTVLGQGVKTWIAVRSHRDLSGSAVTWGEDQSAHSLLPTAEVGSKYAQSDSTARISRKGRVATTASARARSGIAGAIQGTWKLRGVTRTEAALGKWFFGPQHHLGGYIQTRPLETEKQESAEDSKTASDTDPLCEVHWQHSHTQKHMTIYNQYIYVSILTLNSHAFLYRLKNRQ